MKQNEKQVSKKRHKRGERKQLNKRRKEKYRKMTKDHHKEAIYNLSSRQLTKDENAMLSKGLSFIPTYRLQPYDITKNMDEFTRHLYSIHHQSKKSKTTKKIPFYKKTNWQPPTPKDPKILGFIKTVREISQTTKPFPRVPHTNITLAESQALTNLMRDKAITIKAADKGGSIVVMDTKDYINKAKEHLSDTKTYSPQRKDYTTQTATLINDYLDRMLYSYQLDLDTVEYLRPDEESRTPLFYFNPKMHKDGNPPRPIISGCQSPTDRLSNYISKIITPIAQIQPSYLKDSKDLLQILKELPKLDQQTYIVTADVSSLYTNIPNSEGIAATIEALKQHKESTPPYTPSTDIMRELMAFTLERNYFKFMDQDYLQIHGCAMGTKMAPNYANLFMAKLETAWIADHAHFIRLWRRYLDDIFCLFRGTESQLKDFITTVNNSHASIKLDFEYSKDHANFLDLHIYKDGNNKLQTTIYRKKTNKNLLLHFKSHHSLHIKRNIVYTQALRYKRLISEPDVLLKELGNLCDIFIARGYPRSLIRSQIEKAKLIPRTELLKHKQRKGPKKQPILRTPMDRATARVLKTKITGEWIKQIAGEQQREESCPTPRYMTQRDGQNLRAMLIHTNQRDCLSKK